MTNEKLVSIIQSGESDNSVVMELWNQNRGIILKACGKYSGYIEKEDALQECFIAFLDAVQVYDPASGQKFAGFIYNRCRWHLYRYRENCGDMIRIPAGQRQTISRYKQFTRQMYQERGELPDDAEICRVLQLGPGQLEQLRKDMQTVDVERLEAQLCNDMEKLTAADIVPDLSVDVEGEIVERVHDQELRRAVWAAVRTLSPVDGQALQLYYRDGLTCKQAAGVMGIKLQRVKTCITRGLRQLRTGKRGKALREFIEMAPEHSRICGSGLESFNRTWTSCTESAALWRLEAIEKQLR